MLLWLEERGEKTFRTAQIWKWLYQKRVSSFSEMSDLSLTTRSLLDEHFVLKTMSADKVQYAKVGMKSKKINHNCGRLFEQRLSGFLNPKQALFQLADSIPYV